MIGVKRAVDNNAGSATEHSGLKSIESTGYEWIVKN